MGYGTNGLTFNVLRRANIHRLPQFRDKQERIAHRESDGSDWSKAEWLQAVVGELGKFANLAKKVRRGDFTQDEVQKELADELADVVTYLDILALQYGVDLGKAVIDKFNRISKRVSATTRITVDGSEVISDTVGGFVSYWQRRLAFTQARKLQWSRDQAYNQYAEWCRKQSVHPCYVTCEQGFMNAMSKHGAEWIKDDDYRWFVNITADE